MVVNKKIGQPGNLALANWPDAVEAISRLKEKFMVSPSLFLFSDIPSDRIVLSWPMALRLQLDVIQSSGLPFHITIVVAALGKALDLLQVSPEIAVMVTAHAYDLRAAQQIGMKTVYIHRDTEHPDEDMGVVRSEVDVFIESLFGQSRISN
ncbi:uncharacterized protein ATNIH1004_009363 [Aspergillus tanneri]|uniref:Haloacid dehalogenase, type II n=2 Tax=Aspergillus tanneri TaxID=1220188 RepID=A0A5M9MH76_9EURO|nr:uncharacterized protein ATNIH1004_009363 [Aspergillus tanneri]KAA8645146.1 hypothetical protein ATNIH1004_009363 [Aspergillus tanneri]